jgi:hypothetical protein
MVKRSRPEFWILFEHVATGTTFFLLQFVCLFLPAASFTIKPSFSATSFLVFFVLKAPLSKDL